jgi:hypothetical protein
LAWSAICATHCSIELSDATSLKVGAAMVPADRKRPIAATVLLITLVCLIMIFYSGSFSNYGVKPLPGSNNRTLVLSHPKKCPINPKYPYGPECLFCFVQKMVSL